METIADQLLFRKKKTTAAINLLSGGTAGLCEALSCHPLDTIKVRMQLTTRAADGAKRVGFFGTAKNIVSHEGFFALYKGLGAVITGIVPKMAIRFSSFEYYKTALANKETGKTSPTGVFFAGLAAGTTEAVLVVNPTDVVKIRLQAQHHSMTDPLDAAPKYRNAAQCAYLIVREEGLRVLYRGVILTALRQATNQAVNFTAYTELKAYCAKLQPELTELPSYQHMVLGLISGALGPLSNAPIDTIKTRMQREKATRGESALGRVGRISRNLIQKEGFLAFYKGITPRVMRVAPGQAVTFAVYEQVSTFLETIPALSGKAVLSAED
ncbi:mitochondrial carrier domain-containing protein [Myxozyma melibiosi]|uniref:Mitochondrial carrier domain-containing protein n=1 Tax=Myxozyma melibiosi TaxID=54550 RepID=A0ABR1FA44_9ASCO